MEINLRALRKRQPASDALRRYDEAARILTGNQNAIADDGVGWMRELCAALKIPRLRTYGLAAGDLSVLCEKASVASSVKGNPLALTDEEMREILERAL
jgi:alcohol dehydrogenase class IV